MIEFNTYWILYLIPLPLLVYWLFPAKKAQKKSALVTPFYQQLTGGSTATYGLNSLWFMRILALCAWLFLVIAAADPQLPGEPIKLPTKGRNLMMAVDLSGSMAEEDFNFQGRIIDRLTATKIVAGNFIEQRKGDRLGLILFADQAYTQTPLTFDTNTVRQLLDEAVIGLAGKKTAIGDAIALAVKKMEDTKAQQKILILLTDGTNTAGKIDPIIAAKLAAKSELKIYTIGIGPHSGGGFMGNNQSQVDEKTLSEIAKLTGGEYFRASNLQELSRIYQLLDQLEPVSQEEQFFRPKASLYFWPLLLGGFFLSLYSLINIFNRR
jgi:Ca-activated chloride channel family protein